MHAAGLLYVSKSGHYAPRDGEDVGRYIFILSLDCELLHKYVLPDQKRHLDLHVFREQLMCAGVRVVHDWRRDTLSTYIHTYTGEEIHTYTGEEASYTGEACLFLSVQNGTW